MSFRILTSRQREQYGRFLGPPTPEQLEEYFRLDEADCRFARELRAFASQLCCAVQLGTLRFLGTFLPDPRSVPSNVVDFVAAQLRLSPLLLQRVEKPATWREQRRKIAQREGYRDFETVQSEFQDWLFQYLWLSSERLAVVFDRCTNWLAENQILLPPAETLESLIGATASRARDALSGLVCYPFRNRSLAGQASRSALRGRTGAAAVRAPSTCRRSGEARKAGVRASP